MNAAARRVFLGGQAVSLLGDGLAVLAVPLLVLRLTRDPLLAGLAAAPRGIGYLLVGVPAGALADRWDAWTVLVAADVARAGVFVALPVMTWADVAPLPVVLGLAVVAGIATVFFDAALGASLKDLFANDGLLRANAVMETSAQLAAVVGPAAVAFLAATAGLGTALLANAATFTLSCASLLTVSRTRPERARARPGHVRAWTKCVRVRSERVQVPSERVRARKERRGMFRDFVEGVRFLRGCRPLLAVTVVQVGVNLCLAVDTLIVYLGRVTLGLPTHAVAALVAAEGVGGVAGAMVAGAVARRLGAMGAVTAGVVGVGTSLAVMGTVSDAWALIAANAVQGAAVTLASVVNRSARQAWIPRPLMGRVTTTIRSMVIAVTPIGAALAGVASRASGDDPRPVFVAAGTLAAGTILIGWATVLRRLPPPPF
ncbi:MFS transporter [Actinomadura oligospora]|uniref:MFS transporter n=1 Tax=Actinomadura oligospora TaxID=111804 RepID=UPI00047AFB2C|nr:MFS transporter [Actinomadura oligospora]